ncbi:hypothetical protein F5877DRAFT_84919 [Lentinula edodes]|nr:hypothetical protein F5877DRAFT_84919 [Lentinula edodes]
MDGASSHSYSAPDSHVGQRPPSLPQSLPSFHNTFFRHEYNTQATESGSAQPHPYSTSTSTLRSALFSPSFNTSIPLLPSSEHLSSFSLPPSPSPPLSDNSPQSISQSPRLQQPQPPTAPVISVQAVDNLAKDFRCTEGQRSVLHSLVRFGSVGEGLSKADLSTRLLTLAVIFDLENQRPKEDENDLQSMRAMWKDLKIRLEQTFLLTAAQTKSIRLIAQEKIYDPLRTCYLGLNRDVFDYIKANSEEMRFSNVFGNAAYEDTLEKAIKKVCSSVRNAFRQHLRDSVEKGTNVAIFTHNMNKIYIRMAGPNYNERLLLLRNVVLRRFIFDNPNVLWAEEDPNHDDSGPEPSNTGSGSLPEIHIAQEESLSTPLRSKKRKTAAVGRVRKGQDFWSLVDAWFVSKRELGKKLTDPGWKQLLEEYVEFDENGFRDRHQLLTPVAMQAGGVAGVLQSDRGHSTLQMLI